MSDELRVRRRSRLRNKESKDLREGLAASLGGAALWPESAAVETGEFLERKVLVVDNKVVGLFEGGPEDQSPPFLTVKGLLQYRPAAKAVTVDMGAVKFVVNGADVMGPGIVAADPALQPGDWCWVKDEKNGQPLAVGRALVAGPAMVKGKGKAVKSVHHLGDKLWGVEA